MEWIKIEDKMPKPMQLLSVAWDRTLNWMHVTKLYPNEEPGKIVLWFPIPPKSSKEWIKSKKQKPKLWEYILFHNKNFKHCEYMIDRYDGKKEFDYWLYIPKRPWDL